ncbi:reverse transcriptase domain-containing protein [Tanacetum coccineum]
MSTQSSSNQISLHLPNLEKSLQFRPIEVSECENLFLDHLHGEEKNVEDVQMVDHLRPGWKRYSKYLSRRDVVEVDLSSCFFSLMVPHDVVKLILFPFLLKGAAETWHENEPPCSITTWDDLVSKFLNRFFPHFKTRELRKEITNFQQVFGETFTEAWERFKDLLRKCPHHGFSLLHQIDFFYNWLCQSDQDSLNSAAGGNLMTRNIQEALTIIENKAKVRTCRIKPQVSSSGGTSTQIDAITALTKQVKALEYHIASMRETYDQNQEAPIQLMQMGQLEEAFQERPLGVLPSDTEIYPQEEHKAVTTMSGLTLDGSFIPHSNFLIYQDKELELETITEVVEIKSSGITNSHYDLSLLEYESFHFDLSIDPLPPVDRSDSQHEEFADGLAHIISPPENKDKNFDPGIFIFKGVQSQRFHILPLDDFSTISFVSDSLLPTDTSEIETFLSFPFRNEDKVFNPRILIINGVFSFTRNSPHLLIDNFMIDNCYILSEISLKIASSISFHPKDKEIWGESS